MKKIIVAILLFFILPVATFAKFSDVPENHPNYEAIMWAEDQGIIEGYEDGTFRPDEKINRAEFLKIVMSVETLDPTSLRGKNCFTDVQEQWYAPYVCTAKEQGVVKGYEDGAFRPEQNIFFVEVAKIIALSYDLSLSKIPHEIRAKESRHYETIYTFSALFESDWFRNYVLTLFVRDAVPRTIFQLDHYVSRSEVVYILWKLTNKEEQQYSDLDVLHKFNRQFASAYKRIEDKKQIVYRSENIIEEADYDSFQLLDHNQARDKNFGYFRGEKIIGSDGKSFVYLTENYSQDKNTVYLGSYKLKHADLQTFQVEKFYFGYKNNNLYVDKQSFLDSHEYAYAKDKNHVYLCKNEDNDLLDDLVLKDADPATFQLLGGGQCRKYLKDKNNCYIDATCKGEPCDIIKINDCDGSSFEFLSTYNYSKDKNNIYYWADKIEIDDLDIDIESFECPKIYQYCVDKNSVYYASGKILTKIESADRASFEVMDYEYHAKYDAKDKNHVYKDGEIIEGADPATFKVPEN